MGSPSAALLPWCSGLLSLWILFEPYLALAGLLFLVFLAPAAALLLGCFAPCSGIVEVGALDEGIGGHMWETEVECFVV